MENCQRSLTSPRTDHLHEGPEQSGLIKDSDEKGPENADPDCDWQDSRLADSAARLDLEEAHRIIEEAVERYNLDPNAPTELLKRAEDAIKQKDLNQKDAVALIEEIKLKAAQLEETPFPEVRAVTSTTDDPDMPVSTFRAWFIGLTWTAIGTGINVFFQARLPGIAINTFVGQVLSLPAGRFLAAILPTRSVTIFGHKCSLNPGPFNAKEQLLITIMGNVTYGGQVGVYSTDLIAVLAIKRFYGLEGRFSNAGFQLLMTLSTQFLGLGLAGLTRRFLVYPPMMLWPVSLASIALNNIFHEVDNPIANGWKIGRYRFFLIVFLVYGVYFVFPDAIMTFLGTFNWMTWIRPDNVHLAAITGSISGLGFNPWPTFDYNVASILKDPLITPLFAIINLFAGQALLGMIIIPALWYTNTWETGYLGINDNGVFDRFGKRYNVSRVLDPTNQSLNTTAYEEYSPTYLSAGNGLQYGFFFAMYTAVIVHVALYYYKELIQGFKSMLTFRSGQQDYKDIHNRLMAAYQEVPEWWYFIILVFSLATGIAYNIHYSTDYPVWALFAALAMSAIFVIPCGIVYAVTNVEVTMNVLAELIGGYALPGKPIAVMLFKSYGFVSTAQAIGYAADLKIGHYAHIGPRHLFFAQVIASAVACFIGVGVLSWQMNNISDFCNPGQVNRFTCPGYQTYFTASVIWGAIGPRRLYSYGGIYYSLIWFFLIGAIAPIPLWYMARKKGGIWKFINVPVFVTGALNWSPYNMSYAIPMLYCGLFVNGFIKGRYFPWWNKYRWVLATALSASIAIFGFLWFFAILFKNYQPEWWGNSVINAGCDGNSCARLQVPEGGFGPAPGNFFA